MQVTNTFYDLAAMTEKSEIYAMMAVSVHFGVSKIVNKYHRINVYILIHNSITHYQFLYLMIKHLLNHDNGYSVHLSLVLKC